MISEYFYNIIESYLLESAYTLQELHNNFIDGGIV